MLTTNRAPLLAAHALRLAVAQGIVRAARARQAAIDLPARRGLAAFVRDIDAPQWIALGVIAAGIVTGFTRLRGTWFGRLALPVAVLLYLGFGAGALLSQAQLWGWAQAGVPRGAAVLLALAVAALVLPVTTRRSISSISSPSTPICRPWREPRQS